MLLLGIVFLYIKLNMTTDNITKINLNAQIEYANNLTNNIANNIKINIQDKNIYDVLKHNKALVSILEQHLSMLVTKRYRYVYVVDKMPNDINKFRFLLDGSLDLENKSEFAELYTPLNIDKWNEPYKTKKQIFFRHKDDTNLWMTYINPIIVDKKVIALVVVDFDLQEHEQIVNSLDALNDDFELIVMFFIIVFFIIIQFSFFDLKREKEKANITKQLKITNLELEQRVLEGIEQSRKKDQQILEQSRLAQMGEMISMIAHQWRQPLSAISAVSASLELKSSMNIINNDIIIKSAQKISEYSQHLSITINDFRNFFKHEKKEQETSYAEIIESVLGIVQVSIENKNIQIIQELHSTRKFKIYANELKQVLLNLIKNAEDVLQEKNILNPYIKILTYDQDDKHIVEVIDNAGGVPDDIVDKIFNPYFSTKLDKNGTGLGLYMSKIIIEEHCNGSLSLLNNDDGAVFKISL